MNAGRRLRIVVVVGLVSLACLAVFVCTKSLLRPWDTGEGRAAKGNGAESTERMNGLPNTSRKSNGNAQHVDPTNPEQDKAKDRAAVDATLRSLEATLLDSKELLGNRIDAVRKGLRLLEGSPKRRNAWAQHVYALATDIQHELLGGILYIVPDSEFKNEALRFVASRDGAEALDGAYYIQQAFGGKEFATTCRMHIEDLLSHEDAEIRRGAVSLLTYTELPLGPVKDQILDMILNDPSQEVRQHAVYALEGHGREDVETLSVVASKSRDPIVLKAVIERMLGVIQTDSDADQLSEYLAKQTLESLKSHSDSDVRAAARAALEEIKG